MFVLEIDPLRGALCRGADGQPPCRSTSPRRSHYDRLIPEGTCLQSGSCRWPSRPRRRSGRRSPCGVTAHNSETPWRRADPSDRSDERGGRESSADRWWSSPARRPCAKPSISRIRGVTMTMNSPSAIDRLEVVDRMRAVAIDLVEFLELNARHAFLVRRSAARHPTPRAGRPWRGVRSAPRAGGLWSSATRRQQDANCGRAQP